MLKLYVYSEIIILLIKTKVFLYFKRPVHQHFIIILHETSYTSLCMKTDAIKFNKNCNYCIVLKLMDHRFFSPKE